MVARSSARFPATRRESRLPLKREKARLKVVTDPNPPDP